MLIKLNTVALARHRAQSDRDTPSSVQSAPFFWVQHSWWRLTRSGGWGYTVIPGMRQGEKHIQLSTHEKGMWHIFFSRMLYLAYHLKFFPLLGNTCEHV